MSNPLLKNPRSLKNLAGKVALVLAVCLPAAQAHAGNMSCENESGFSKLACHALMGTIFVVGGSVAVVSSVKMAMTPDTNVKVLLPSGEVIAGKLTAMAIQSRNIKNGDTVQLDCTQSPALSSTAKESGEKWSYMCQIYQLDASSGESLPYPSYASIGQDGTPQESVITLERPLRWVDGKGI